MQSSIARPRHLAPRSRPILIVGIAALVAAGTYVAGALTGGPTPAPDPLTRSWATLGGFA